MSRDGQRAQPPHCDLCGVEHPTHKLAVAMLREPSSNARVTVPRVCAKCRPAAWRTIEQPAPVEIPPLPLLPPPEIAARAAGKTARKGRRA